MIFPQVVLFVAMFQIYYQKEFIELEKLFPKYLHEILAQFVCYDGIRVALVKFKTVSS